MDLFKDMKHLITQPTHDRWNTFKDMTPKHGTWIRVWLASHTYVDIETKHVFNSPHISYTMPTFVRLWHKTIGYEKIFI